VTGALAAAPWLATVAAGLLTGHAVLNTVLLRRPARSPSTVDEPVAVLLPLRDEAHRVRPCLESLLAQRGVPDLSVVVLDDGSTDGTAAVVREVAGDRVTLVTGAPLPPGWLGKPYACRQLAGYAPASARVLVFVDADVVLHPDAVAATVGLLRAGRYTLLSAYPRLPAGTAAERLVQPLLAWSWLTFLPLRLMERSSRPSLAAAGGQFLAVDRAGYERAGGHAAVRDKVLEDVELARAVTRSGGRIALATGHRLATCRMYRSWPALRDGYGKSLWAAFGSPAGSAAVLLALAGTYLLPLAAVVRNPPAAVLAYLLGVAGRVVTGRATGARVWPDALAHPASVALFGYLVLRSHLAHRRGRLVWKGRELP